MLLAHEIVKFLDVFHQISPAYGRGVRFVNDDEISAAWRGNQMFRITGGCECALRIVERVPRGSTARAVCPYRRQGSWR